MSGDHITDAPYQPPPAEVRSVFPPAATQVGGNQSPGFGYGRGADGLEQAGGSSSSTAMLQQMQQHSNIPAAIGLSASYGAPPVSAAEMLNNRQMMQLNQSYMSSTGNRTPKQVVHNYLGDKKHFSPVPLPRTIGGMDMPGSATDLAFLRNSVEQETKRVAVINERLGFLEDQNRTFRELCWDKIAHLEKEAVNLKEQVLEKMATMEQAQRMNLQEHALQVTALSQKVDDFASDESTQQRVQKALLKELDELKIVENIQNLSGSLKASVAKLEDRVRHTGEHAEKLLHENLRNAKEDLSQLMDMKLKEFFVANVVPLQKELTTEKQETAMKTKELEYNLTTLDQTVDRNRTETVEALAETRRSTLESVRVCEKEWREGQESLSERHLATETLHQQQIAQNRQDTATIQNEILPKEIAQMRHDFLDKFDTYQKEFESKMFNLLAVREKEEAAALPAQNQANIAQLTQTVYQNAEVLEQVKFQVLENVKNFSAMRENFGGNLMEGRGESEQLRSGLEKVKKWACELDGQVRDLEGVVASAGLGGSGLGSGGAKEAAAAVERRVEQMERDLERRLEAQERRHADILLQFSSQNLGVASSRPSSPQRVQHGGRRNNNVDGKTATTRRSISSTLAQSVNSVFSTSADQAGIEQTLPVSIRSKADLAAVLRQLETELRTVAEATEQELDLIRVEVFDHVEEKCGEVKAEMSGVGSSSSATTSDELLFAVKGQCDELGKKLLLMEMLANADRADRARGLGGNSGAAALAPGEIPGDKEKQRVDGKIDALQTRVSNAMDEQKRELVAQVRKVERDLDLSESKAREANLELQVKHERLEKMILQERSQAGAISAAYAAAERRGRGGGVGGGV